MIVYHVAFANSATNVVIAVTLVTVNCKKAVIEAGRLLQKGWKVIITPVHNGHYCFE